MAARRTALEYPGHPQLSQTQAREDGLLSARNIKIFLAVAVLVGAFGYFAFVAFESATRFYYTVGEVHDVSKVPLEVHRLQLAPHPHFRRISGRGSEPSSPPVAARWCG